MQAIYTPTGKALEYCERAVNLYRGCGHGCRYCYAPNALHITREAFAITRQRDGILEALAKDAPKHKGREVLLSFTCDPYQDETAAQITRQAIDILHDAGCLVVILTKGGMRSAQDLNLLRPGDKYGVTLTFDNAEDSKEWEPGAALPDERIRVLRMAKANGVSTWASLEPVIDPEQSLHLIGMTYGCVDLYKIGRWNHDARANAIDWHDFVTKAVALCEEQGSAYKLKKDLAIWLEEPRQNTTLPRQGALSLSSSTK